MAVQIDPQTGLYLSGLDLPDYKGEQTETIIKVEIPQDEGFWHPRWNKQIGAWEEGLSESEIASRKGLPQSLNEAKALIQQQIIDHCKYLQDSLASDYAQTEQNSWDDKLEESRLFLATEDLDKVYYLKIEAIADAGVDISAPDAKEQIISATRHLAQSVTRKAHELKIASHLLSGIRAHKWKTVASMTDLEAVLNYPVKEGWELEPYFNTL